MMPERLFKGNDRMLAIALFEVLMLFIVISCAHELGHIVLYELTHEQSPIIRLGEYVWVYVIYPTPIDQFSMLVTWGGFLASAWVIPLYRKMNTFGKLFSSMLLLYGFVEGINGMTGKILGGWGMAALSVIPVYIGAIIWAIRRRRRKNREKVIENSLLLRLLLEQW